MDAENRVLVGWTLRQRRHLPPTLYTIGPGGRVIAYSTLLQIIGVRTNFFLVFISRFLASPGSSQPGCSPFCSRTSL